LAQGGARCRRNGAWESYVYVPGRRYPLDLHRRLLLPGSFGLATMGVFARARLDTGLYGAPVWLPDPLDVYAHLVGHYLCSHARPDDTLRLDDFQRVASAGSLEPGRCARHLVEHGLGRAARHVLPQLVAAGRDEFARQVLSALPPDAMGDALVRAVRWGAQGPPRARASVRGALSTHLLARSLAFGAFGLGLRFADKARTALGSKRAQRHG
jgi:hypothetical protein